MPLGALCLDLQSFHVLRLEPDRAFLFFPTKSSKQKLQIRAPDLGNRGPRVSGQSAGPFHPQAADPALCCSSPEGLPVVLLTPRSCSASIRKVPSGPQGPPSKAIGSGRTEVLLGLAAARTSPVPTAGDGEHLLRGWVSCAPGSPRVTGLEPHGSQETPRANTSLRPETERPGEGRRCKELRATLAS